MTTTLYLITICLPCATVLIVFGMRYAAKVQEARARLANDGAYRATAEKAVASQTETATALAAIQSSLASIEKMLKEVG